VGVQQRHAADVPHGGVYHFVSGGVEQALAEAKAAAGDKNVSVMGGADIGQQFIRSGLVDELSIHLVPLISAAAHRCSRTWASSSESSRSSRVVPGPTATHIRYELR
jgi:dihydrofolate reductase